MITFITLSDAVYDLTSGDQALFRETPNWPVIACVGAYSTRWFTRIEGEIYDIYAEGTLLVHHLSLRDGRWVEMGLALIRDPLPSGRRSVLQARDELLEHLPERLMEAVL